MRFVTLPLIFITGCITGVFLLYIADCLISKKTNICAEQNAALFHNFNFKAYINSVHDNIFRTAIFMILNGLGWLFAVLISGFGAHTIQIMMMMSIALIISIVDIKIRIIPNEMIMFLIFTSFIFILSGTIKQPVLSNISGFAIGIALFGILLIMRGNVGGGDIKYMAAMGFCLGYPDIFKAMLIMGSVLLIWVLYLFITKKGGLKTEFAMGPFISIGFVATLLFQK